MGMPFVNVAGLSEIPPGAGSLVTGPADKPMALFEVEAGPHALNHACPYRGVRSRRARRAASW
jgi:nitrite reductase/ring-hydroxylating ferredoxin subunit